ncbi:MAG: hypothetical protein JNN08_03435 [Bryobacterales bacterium]|nr:hypothetical protein [Bryobacterales bacterium]
MRQQIQPKAEWQTPLAALALIEAVKRDDEDALAGVIAWSRNLGQLPGMDAWTAERTELLCAVADAVAEGTPNTASYTLLRHLASTAGPAGRIM